MKKQILGCIAVIFLSATIVTASNSHSVSTNVSTYSLAKDTTPSGSSSNKKGKMHKMKNKSMNDSSSTMGSGSDSTRL